MLCEGLVNTAELIQVLHSMKNGKSPGTDGFTAEFYKFFWVDRTEVLKSLNGALCTGELSTTQKQGIITLLPKNNKPREFFSKLETNNALECRIQITCLSLIKKVLPKIIADDQKGFIKDRYIGENTRTIFDSIQYAKIRKLTGMLLFIDFEKAFDSLEWGFLLMVLKSHNFGPDFVAWFSVLYANSNSSVINNGF